jgi:hypothetical protein
MNDTELLTAVREALPGIRLETTLQDTVRRGRTLRTRRRARGAAAIAGAAALAGCVAVITVGAGATQPTSGKTTLDAWTVTRGHGNTVTVTIRQLYDAAGLQRALRADGIPARVVFQPPVPLPGPTEAGSSSIGLIDPANPAGCESPDLSLRQKLKITDKIIGSGMMDAGSGAALTIRRDAIPAGIGIFLAASTGYQNGVGFGFSLVVAAPSCTG